MSDERDEILDARLSAMLAATVPGHGPGFWEAMSERLERGGTGGTDAGQTPGQGPGQTPGQGPGQIPGQTPAVPTVVPWPVRSLALPATTPLAGPEQPHQAPRRFLRHSPRWVPVAVAASLVGIALAASALTRLGPDDAPPAAPSPSVSQGTPTTPSPSGSPSTTPTGSPAPPTGTGAVEGTVNAYGSETPTELEPVEAATALAEFGTDGPLHVPGTPAFAWTWTDRAGEHLLVLSAKRTHDDTAPVDEQDDSTLYTTLFRYYENAQGTGGVETERRMVDPGADPCSLGYPDGFLPKATQLSDTDGDGVGEVTVGWYFDCRGDIGQDNIRLAVLEGPDKYILRGTAYRFKGAREQYAGPKMTRVPDPTAAYWPRGLLEHAIGVWDGVAW